MDDAKPAPALELLMRKPGVLVDPAIVIVVVPVRPRAPHHVRDRVGEHAKDPFGQILGRRRADFWGTHALSSCGDYVPIVGPSAARREMRAPGAFGLLVKYRQS